MQKIIQEVEERLRSREYKLTPKREHILRVLLKNKDKHLSAEEIHVLVKESSPDIGLATVYRTLELFLNFNIIHSIDFGDGRRRFEFGVTPEGEHHHHHLICTRCGMVIEVAEDLLDELEERVNKNYDFTVNNHELKMYGLCSDCRKRKYND